MLSNLTRADPETAKAQREEKDAATEARKAEIERLRGLYDKFTNENFVKTVLPEDVEYSKKFLKGRIEKLQTSPNMTQDQLAAFKESKEALQFENLYESLRRRHKFKRTFERADKDLDDRIAGLKKEGKPVPDAFYTGKKLVAGALKWFKGVQFETKDVYDDKEAEVNDQYSDLTDGQSLTNLDKTAEAAEDAEDARRSEFSIFGLIKEVLAWTTGYFTIFLMFLAVLLGASLATNLNIYRNWAYRLLYAIYGGAFFFVVIPYVLLYRWAFMGKRPRFYSIIPLIPYHWDGVIGQIFLSWLSFRPDTIIWELEEWKELQP
jgi:hypothetical protein